MAGLYGAIAVGFFAAVCGGTRSQISGPTAPIRHGHGGGRRHPRRQPGRSVHRGHHGGTDPDAPGRHSRRSLRGLRAVFRDLRTHVRRRHHHHPGADAAGCGRADGNWRPRGHGALVAGRAPRRQLQRPGHRRGHLGGGRGLAQAAADLSAVDAGRAAGRNAAQRTLAERHAGHWPGAGRAAGAATARRVRRRPGRRGAAGADHRPARLRSTACSRRGSPTR